MVIRLIFQLKIFWYEFIEKRSVVYIDESGFSVDAPRGRGYSLKGQKCYPSKDWHARGRINAIGPIVNFKLLNVCLFDTYINADVFYAWITKQLLGCIPNNSIIVLDNATFHKKNDALEVIEKQGHTTLFLPPYSPDLNSIEKKWAKTKSLRRKFNYTPEQLFYM